ncbi:ras guanine nucleotide exchange factor domain-containing protein [Neocallimastix sp. 'constans']
MSINVIDTVKVKYNFDGDNSTELSIRKDDIIDVLVIDPSGWADGIIRSKRKRGWFPLQYTRSIVEQENMKLPEEKNKREIDDDFINKVEQAKVCYKRNSYSSKWRKKRTINGKKYYFNIETNETTYNKSRTLKKNDISQFTKEYQNMLNSEVSIKAEGPPPPVQKSAKIMNLANMISNSLSSSCNNLNALSGGGGGEKEIDKLKEHEKRSITPKRLPSSNVVKSDNSLAFGTQVNFYSTIYGGDGGLNSNSSLNLSSSMNGINMAALASAAASVASHNMKTTDISSFDSSGELCTKRLGSLPTFNTSSQNINNILNSQSQALSATSIIEKIKKLEISKNGLTKKNNFEKQHQKIIQMLTDFINSINKNKKGTYLDQCHEIKNYMKKFFVSSNILNQEGGLIASTSNQINLYYTTMLSLSKMILNVRDATGKWPPPDIKQLIFIQMDDFLCNYQLLLNNINFATIASNENGSEKDISSPLINTNPSFVASVEMYGPNALLNTIDHQVSIIMISISDLILASRKEQSINQNIYKLSVECRDNISTLANLIDDIHFKNRNVKRTIFQFLRKKENLMNSIKELTITIKSSNEKFAPSNSLELIIESLSFCINIIDDITLIIKGIYDISDSPCISQQNSFDLNESGAQDNYEFSKKIFGDPAVVANGAFSKKLELLLKKKDSPEIKNNTESDNDNKRIRSLNEKISYKEQNNSEASISRENTNNRLYKTKSNPKIVTVGSKSKINKFFGEDDADIENEKINNSVPKPWYLMSDYPKGSITYNMEGQINGATLTSFIEFVTSHENKDPEFDQRTLLLMYDQFYTTSEFIDHLTKRFFIKPPVELSKENIQEWKEIKQTPIQKKVLDLISLWLSDYWIEDDIENLEKIIKFLNDASNPINHSYCDSAINVLYKAKKMLGAKTKENIEDDKLEDNEIKTESNRNSADSYPHPIIPKTPDKFTFLDIDPIEFTRQMCLLEMEAYTKVRPHELMIVNKKNCKSDSIKMLTKISIRITQYIISVILSDSDPKKRVAYLKHSINICKKSFEERNFDLVFSVIAALNSSVIVRLQKTWALLQTKHKDTLEYCQNQISHTKNYQKYRHILKTCEKPCIPFFGIILKDITFTEDGNSKYRKENLVNISKFHNMATIIEDYNSFKVPYNFKEVPFLQYWIKSNIIEVDEIDEQDLYDLSLKVEPREQTSSNENS